MSEETLMQFPCQFPIKMMGRDTPSFHQITRSLIEKHVGKLDESAVKSNVSEKGNFVSITVTVTATSQQQLDEIYRDVSGHDEVLMAL